MANCHPAFRFSPLGKKEMGRKSDKQVGALVECHRRKVKGLGIIIDRISKQDTVPLPDDCSAYGQKFRGCIWGWEARNCKGNETFVLVQWFKKPSEYSDTPHKHQAERVWLPIAYLKVVSKR